MFHPCRLRGVGGEYFGLRMSDFGAISPNLGRWSQTPVVLSFNSWPCWDLLREKVSPQSRPGGEDERCDAGFFEVALVQSLGDFRGVLSAAEGNG